MLPSDLTAETTYADLAKVYQENLPPFSSIAQIDLCERAGSMLKFRRPAESEHNGERIVTTELESILAECRKARGILRLFCQPATVIVPPDQLR